MSRLFLAALALALSAALLYLFLGPSATPSRARPPARPEAPAEGPVEPEPVVPPEVEAPPPVDGPSPAATLEERLVAGDHESLRGVLAEWRSGRLSTDEERAIDAALAALPPAELDKAAGYALLEGEPNAAQVQGLCSLLATSGSEQAVGVLLEAARRHALAAPALEALGSVSEPGALPALAVGVAPESDPALLRALQNALRNIDAAKARELEASIRAILEP